METKQPSLLFGGSGRVRAGRAPTRHTGTGRGLVLAAVSAVALAACGGTDVSTPPQASSTFDPQAERPRIGRQGSGGADSNQLEDEAAAAGPAGRIYHTMVSAPDTGEVLVFGGQSRHAWTPDLSNVWAYTPTTDSWASRGEVEAGVTSTAAYDTESGKAVMLNDEGETWTYDPAADEWEQMSPATAPSPRCGEGMAYDEQSDLIILFAGFACTSVVDPHHDDTWSYDLNTDTWQEMSPSQSPPARIFHGITYDRAADQVLVWGGRVDDERLWAYDVDSDTWTPHESPGAPEGVRSYHTMTYDPMNDRTLVFGGFGLSSPMSNGGKVCEDLWSYDLATNTWTRLQPDSPPAGRGLHDMVFDPGTGTHVLFGGETDRPYSDEVTNETWIFDAAVGQWTESSAATDELAS